MSLPMLRYGRQSIDQDDIDAVIDVLRSDFLTTGPAVEAFERMLCDVTGARESVVCSSGTAALHMMAMALDLSPEDNVVVPSMTFMGTASAMRLTGAEVIFSDVHPKTGLMEAENLEEALRRAGSRRVKVAIPVQLNGWACDMKALNAVAEKHGVTLLEDAAHAIGTTVTENGRNVPVGACTQSKMAIFSFHPVKTITSAEGGAVTTNDSDLAARLRRLRSHGITHRPEEFLERVAAFDASGRPNPWYHEMHEPAPNYRLSDVHCALGLSQLKKLDRLVARRRVLAERYDSALEQLAPVVRPVPHVPSCNPGLHLYAVLIDFEAIGIDRAAVMQLLREQGVGTQVHYIPVHRQPYYRRRYGDLNLPGADAYYARELSLPLFPDMSDSDVNRVVDALAKVVGRVS
ncbi:UDP-4-amino-4,6-dideoxy-N-acetyl-beta-L-altrosamine transaminase [Pseudorhodoplanes sp.]|uniref:UDP-4-amino-4, 6-dideoxy-N-acetyl-beta-L-altrosamine transaminase n=1 Tax=Pseudorhodoplanes sp. TaxID=1934341 RepID=UPI003D0DE0BE